MVGTYKWLVVVAVAGLASCNGGAKPGGAAPGSAGGAAMQAMPVQVAAAQAGSVNDTSSYVASIQSRDSMIISPLVSGILRKIPVKSGDAVAAGATLAEIDPALQQAAVQNLQNSRAAQAATLIYDKQQLDRNQALYEAKIGTQQDFQSAQATYNTAKSQLDSLDAQIQQAQTTLGYYSVTAPRAGIVGDIPVKVGDQVTTATQITTLDSASGLEVYVQVPIEQAHQLKPGLPLEVLDGQGQSLASTRIRFVSPQVDTLTQTILVKGDLTGATAQRLRTQQYVQARITWGSHPAFLVPVLSVVRQGGKDFVFEAAPRGQGYYAHQVPVELGAIAGNNYEVKSGVSAGDKVIVSTTQILAEGMPVMPLPPAGGPAVKHG